MAPDSLPQVAVVIAVKNGMPHIREAVESALAQGSLLGEIIVVDDGSTDGTWDELSGIRDNRLTVARSSLRGVSSARNIGAELASCSWLLFLDADDRLTANAIPNLTAAIERNVIGVYGDYERIDEEGRAFGNRGLLRRARTKPSGRLLERLLGQNLFINGGVLICSREAFKQVGGFEATLSLCEDWHLWCRLAAIGDFVYVPKRVLDYRVHAASVMMSKRRTFEEFAPALRAIFLDAGIKDQIEPERHSQLRRQGEISLLTYCAQQSLRAGYIMEAVRTGMAVLRIDPAKAPWMAARLAGAWMSL
jgi:glycosyltransferase involved in cell wall biosynthesis